MSHPAPTPGAAPSPSKPRIVYVAGYGRSGSTLMDMMLGAHPDAFGMGELARIFDYTLAGERCSCGEAYRACTVWGPVLERVLAGVPGLTLEEAAAVTRRIDARSSLIGGRLNPAGAGAARYAAVWRTLLAAVAERTGRSVLVDSSKSDRGNGVRALALARVCGLDVRMVHQVRDPRAVMWSLLRGSNRKLEAGEPARLPGGVLRALVGWTLANATVHAMEARGLAAVRTRYEDVVTDTAAQLARLGGPLGMELAPVAAHLAAGGALEAGHGVSGNRLRRGGVSALRLDAEWQERLPTAARALALLAWPMSRRYGYRGGR
jgi:hypothetical protein